MLGKDEKEYREDIEGVDENDTNAADEVKLRKSIIYAGAVILMLIAAVASVLVFNIKTAKGKQVSVAASKVAVVNLDDGCKDKTGKDVFFAKSIIKFEDDNFNFTTFEDAFNGSETGKYAAVVIIPADFSRNIESLNNTLEKSEIRYYISDSISEESKTKAVERVLNFGKKLSQDVSYMYINDVMKEFHTAQDDSKKVMKNDLKDKEAIDMIQAADFMSLIEVPDVTTSDNEAEMFDSSPYAQANSKLAEEITDDYDNRVEKIKGNGDKLKEYAKEVKTDIKDAIGELSKLTDIGGEALGKGAKTAFDNLAAFMDTTWEFQQAVNDDISAMSENRKYLADCYVDTMEKFDKERAQSANEMANEMADRFDLLELKDSQDESGDVFLVYKERKIKINLAQAQSSNERDSLKDMVDDVNRDRRDGFVAGAQSISEKLSFDGSLYKKVSDNSYEPILISENGIYRPMDMVDAITDSSQIGKLYEDYNSIRIPSENMLRVEVAEHMLQPIENKVKKWDKQAIDTNNIMDTSYNDFVKDVDDLDYEADDTLLDKISLMNENLSEVETKVNESNSGYMEYASNSVIGAADSISKMEENVMNAEDEAGKLVEESVSDAKITKEKTSGENQEMLEEFSNLLPNTRLGSLEYSQAYDFISNPMNMTDASNTEKDSLVYEIMSGKDERANYIITLIIGVLLGIIVSVSANTIYKRRMTEDRREER